MSKVGHPSIKWLGILGVAGILTASGACKPRVAGSSLKEGESEPGEEGLESGAGQPVALDVSDVSILFPKVLLNSGTRAEEFYPKINLQEKIDGVELWPRSAFSALMTFAGGGKIPALRRTLDVHDQDADFGQDCDRGKNTAVVINEGCEKGIVTRNLLANIDLNGPRGSDVKNQTTWRAVGLRVDPCAGPHGATCTVEFRIIAQPTDKTGKTLDFAAHLLWEIGTLNVETGEITGERRPGAANLTLKDITDHLMAIKNAAKGVTNGKPLGVHAGLDAEKNPNREGPVAKAVMAMVRDLSRGHMTRTTSMQLSGDKQPWTFFQGAVTEDQQWIPDDITGPARHMSIQTAHAGGKNGDPRGGAITGFKPAPPELKGDLAKAFFSMHAAFAPDAQRRPPNDFVKSLPYIIDNPGQFGKDESRPLSGNVVADKVSVLTTDCISCHSGATRAAALGSRSVEHRAEAYIPEAGITGFIAENAIPRASYDFRNFGYFVVQREDGGRGKIVFTTEEACQKKPEECGEKKNADGSTKPAILRPIVAVDEPRVMSRTLNESAELAKLLNNKLLPLVYSNKRFANPGFTCGNDEDKYLEVWDCYIVDAKDYKQCFQSICGSVPGEGAAR